MTISAKPQSPDQFQVPLFPAQRAVRQAGAPAVGSMLLAGRRPPQSIRIALIGNYLPRLCGIATFTTRVDEALREGFPKVATDVYAMVDAGRSYRFPSTVIGTIAEQDRDSYRAAGRAIKARGSDVLWVQHEFGIFGGPAGSYLLDLLDETDVPVAVTLHTVLTDPTSDQRLVMDGLRSRAELIIVMAEHARTILMQTYDVPAARIAVIPHGVPDRPFVEPSDARRRSAIEDRRTILTFGLLSPDKGIETMIRAMPRILSRNPDVLYRVLGATHPHLVAHEGEAYRERLQKLAATLGVSNAIRWENRFVDETELLDQLAAADIYVSPYRNPAQITSGTLAYAAGLGKPIIATPNVHATELLAGGRGRIFDFDDVSALAEIVGSLLDDELTRDRMARAIYAHSRGMTWHCMVERVMERFEAIVHPETEGLLAAVSA
jgi:glycosyltransferase involved in cell wall biosynthesis